MTDLITRLEQAEAGSAELEAHIWCLLNGAKYKTSWCGSRSFERKPGFQLEYTLPPKWTSLVASGPPWTRSLDAIVALIGEKLPGKQTGMLYKAMSHLNDRHALHCRFWKAEIDGSFSEKLALALCIALLRAIKEGEHG